MRPAKYDIRKRRQTISVFRGINRGINTSMSRISSSNSSLFMEFKDTRNVSLEDYPAVRSRKERIYLGKKDVMYESEILSNILVTKRGIVYLENSGLLYFGSSDTYTLFTPLSSDDENKRIKRTLYEYGNSIIIFPDKIILTPKESEGSLDFEKKDIEAEFTSEGAESGTFGDVPSVLKVTRDTSVEPAGYHRQSFAMKLWDTEEQKNEADQAYRAFYGNLKLGDILEDTKTEPSTIYMVTEIKTGKEYEEYFDSRLVICTQIYNTFTKISREGIGKGFNVDDWVRLSLFEGEAEKLNSSYKILEVSDDYIVINHELIKSIEYTGAMKIERKMPCDMDFLVVSDNRVWGCSSENNRIYSSRLGDMTNWEAYGDGISTDSYWADVSTEGEFTGAAVSAGAIYFFKENCIHRIMGTKPRNFTISVYEDMGIQKGSEASVIWVKDRMFYHSPRGVCVYSPGGEPSVISDEAFGSQRYRDAVAGKHKDKYYISLINTETKEAELYSYDTNCNQWLFEDNVRFSSTATYNNLLYFSEAKNGLVGCIEDEEDNLLRVSFEAYNVQMEENSIGETINGRVIGDVNADGLVTFADAILLQRYTADPQSFENAEEIIEAGDVNSDGVINVRDATLLKKWVDAPELYKEEPQEFLLESGDLYDAYPDKKYIQKIELILELLPGAELSLMLSKDRKPFEHKRTLYADRKREVKIPMYPGRCDHFRIRLSGRGQFILYSVTLTTEGGGR